MYVENIKNDFYEFLSGKRIFLMVHYDIDSICACKILQNLFRFKHILYTLSVIRGVENLKTAFDENCKDVKYFVLINCGGTVDLVEFLRPEDDIVFYVLDSHRPLDVWNIYSEGQIRLLGSPDEDSQVPELQDIYREDSEDEDQEPEEDDEGEERAAKRRRLGEAEIMKRRDKRLWEENRNKLLFEYSQFTFYAKASAVAMFNLAWQLNRDDKELLWLAIVAITEQFVTGKIEDPLYVLETGTLQTHSNRLRNRSNDSDVCLALKITYEKDLKLVLYRHWSVESSLKYSMIPACKLKLWSHQGGKKLQELMADMGLPLVQSRQAFYSMDLQLRKEFRDNVEKLSEKYGLQELIYNSFVLQYGYRNKYGASDFVYALLSILESMSKERNSEECFNLALDCLSKNNKEVITSAMERSKVIQKSIFKTVQGAVDMKQIITTGPFIYYIIQEGCLDWYIFSQPHILSLLAHFIQRAYVSNSRNRKAPKLPLIVSAPKNVEAGTCIMVGIPPLDENSPKNCFGKVFEQAADNMNCSSACEHFDTSYFEIFVKDRMRFFDQVHSLLFT